MDSNISKTPSLQDEYRTALKGNDGGHNTELSHSCCRVVYDEAFVAVVSIPSLTVATKSAQEY